MAEVQKSEVQALQEKIRTLEESLQQVKSDAVRREQQFLQAVNKKEKLLDEDRERIERESRQRASKFTEERDQWLRQIKAREGEIELLRSQLSEKEGELHRILEEKDQRLKDVTNKLESEGRERDRRIWMERESLTKQYETQIATRESQARTALERKDAEFKEAREQFHREVKELRVQLDQERAAADQRFQGKDAEVLGAKVETAQKLADLQAVWQRRLDELQLELEQGQRELQDKDRQVAVQREQATQQWEERLREQEWKFRRESGESERQREEAVARATAQLRQAEAQFAEERDRLVRQNLQDMDKRSVEVESAVRAESKAALDRKEQERLEGLAAYEVRHRELERKLWEERESVKRVYEEQLANLRTSLLTDLRKKEEELALNKDRHELQHKDLSMKFEADRKAWMEQLKRREDELATVKAGLMRELTEQKIQVERRETEVRESLKKEMDAQTEAKAKEFQAMADRLGKERDTLMATYEGRLKVRETELMTLMDSERRKADQVQERYQQDVRLLQTKLDEERRTSLELLESRENELLSLKGELVQKGTQHRRVLEERDTQLRELEGKLDAEVKDREKRLWADRDALIRQFEERLAKREIELKTQLKDRERSLQELQDRFQTELRQLSKRLEEEREQWMVSLKTREREWTQSQDGLTQKVAQQQALLEKRELELVDARDRVDTEKREGTKAIRAELETALKALRSKEDELSRFRVELALQESQMKAAMERKELEFTAAKDHAEREVRLLQKRFEGEKSAWLKALKQRDQDSSSAKRELLIRQMLQS